MRALSFLFVLGASLAWTQSAPPATSVKPDTVIAVFEDGSRMTQGELQTLLTVLPDNWRAMAERDAQRFLHVYGVVLKGAAMAKSQNLSERSPYKEGLDFTILSKLADFYVQESTRTITVTPEEIEKYYNDNKGPFQRFKVSGIKVAFGGTAAPADAAAVPASRIPRKVLTEEEAKAKAEKLVAQIRGGADFAKLVPLESDDENTKSKGGDLGVWGMTDNVPDALRTAVLSLKEGEVSEPIRQPGGFYIIHADAVTYAPLAEVKDSIFTQLKQAKTKDWLDKLDKDTKVVFPPKDPPAPAAPSDPKK
jgi:peptidyl-prolyl cis-trans isomerase C